MKPTIALAFVVLGASIAPLALADDQDADRAHPPTFVKDSAITTKIKSKLAAEHLSSLGRIHVDTDANGVVYLSGTAHSQGEIDKAVDIAQRTEHVVSVNNRLTVRPDD
jgi:hyperosmotically inducible protein